MRQAEVVSMDLGLASFGTLYIPNIATGGLYFRRR